MVPCFSLLSNVIRALKEAYGLDSNPHRSLLRLRHLSLSLTRLVSHRCCCLSFALFLLHLFSRATGMAAALHPCDDGKSDDVTSVSA